MRKTILSKLLLVAALAVFITSCSEDAAPPFIQVLTDVGFVSDGDFVTPGVAFQVRVDADKGDNDLESAEFLRDGSRLDPTDLTINGDPASSAAPLLFEPDNQGFTWDLGIVAHDSGTATYTFRVTDTEGSTDEVSISLTAVSGDLMVTVNGDTEIQTAPESFTQVPLTVTSAGPALSTISVTSGGADVAVEDLRFDSDEQTAEFVSNPLPFDAAFADGFDGDIYIKAPASGAEDFTITVEDVAGQTASVVVTLRSNTPFDNEFTAVVINNVDGQNKGGLDLRNASNVPETVTGNPNNLPEYNRADLVDKGIDLGQTNALNWYQQILPVNGAELRVPTQAQSEGFTYANAESKEVIVSAFDTGTPVGESPKVAIGDLFVVKKNNDHFLLQCTNIVVTPNDNFDKYEFSVKQAFGN